MLTELILRKKAKEFALKYWGLNFNLPVKINSRFKVTSGLYRYREIDGEHIPLRIDVSKQLLESYKEETIYSLLKHELCHWAMAITGRPFKDGHPIFEKELKRIKAHSTSTLELAGDLHKGTCCKCDRIVVNGPTKRSLNVFIKPDSKYASKCCGERIVYGGTFFQEDTNTSVACRPSRNLSSIIISEPTDDNSSEKNYNK